MPTNSAIARRANKERRQRESERKNNLIRPTADIELEVKYTESMAKEAHKDVRKVEAAKLQITRDDIEKGSEKYRFLCAVINGGYENQS